MKEQLTKRVAAASLGLGLALGMTACDGNPFSHENPNQLADCQPDWSTYSGGADILVNDMASDMAAMEMAHQTLVNDVQESVGVSGQLLSIDLVPAKYRTAVELVIARRNDYYYDMTEGNLDSPREEFCVDSSTGDIYKTPNYVNAVAALKATGIEVAADSRK